MIFRTMISATNMTVTMTDREPYFRFRLSDGRFALTASFPLFFSLLFSMFFSSSYDFDQRRFSKILTVRKRNTAESDTK